MPEFLKKFMENIKNIFQKLTIVQKVIGGVVIAAVIAGIVIILAVNSSQAGVPLFAKSISAEDFDRVTQKLTEEHINYTTKGKTAIYLKSKREADKVRMLLAEKGSIPKGSYSFRDIINSKNMTSTKFMNDVKLREAVGSRLEQMLKASELIDDATVGFTTPDENIYLSERRAVKVAVMLTPAYGVNLSEHRNTIKGIESMVLGYIDGAEKENVTITDNYMKILNDFSDEEDMTKLRLTKENLKIRENIINDYKNKISKEIKRMIPEDRFSLIIDVNMNFDQEQEHSTEVLPVVLKERTPGLSYDDSVKQYSVTISKRTTSEEFKGPNYIPEGPPGFDDNVPPAYQGALEQMTQYTKNDEIVNEVTGERKREKIKDPWEITNITASVLVDGTWEIEYEDHKPVLNPDGSRKRNYNPVSDNDLKTIKSFLEQGIGYSVARGDKVVVGRMQKDRSAQFSAEDSLWKRKQQTTIALIAGLIAIILLIVGTIIYRVISEEIKKRKIAREEELARQRAIAREAALRESEEEGIETDVSMEDKVRWQMQENAIGMAREHPEEVASLIRTWIAEE